MLLALLSLFYYLKTANKKWLIFLIISVGPIALFKVYAGVILIISLTILALLLALRKKFDVLFSLIPAALIFLSTYWIFRDPTSTFIFHPFWAPHNTLIDNFPWYGYTEKFYTYSNASVLKGLIEIELYAFQIFIIGNLGTRFLGILSAARVFIKSRKTPSLFSLTLLLIGLISFAIPMFFLQSGKVFEVIQFAWYYLFIASLFASIGFSQLLTFKNKILNTTLIILIVIATLPSFFSTTGSFIFHSFTTGQSINSPYFHAMRFLQQQGNYNQTLLEIPSLESGISYVELEAWYKDISSPTIIAFANKRSFAVSEYNPFYGMDIKPRLTLLHKILSYDKLSPRISNRQKEALEIQKELLQNNIVFIYSPYPLKTFSTLPHIKQIFQEKGSTVYKIEEKNL